MASLAQGSYDSRSDPNGHYFDTAVGLKLFKRIVKNSFLSLGLDLRRAPEPENFLWLKNHEIRTVIDIGANTGQFARNIRSLIPDATLRSFEPLKDCYEQLLINMAGMPKFRAYNCALGAEEGDSTIYRSRFAPSSSLLPMAELHERTFPHTEVLSKERVKVRRLDEVLDESEFAGNILVKMDVQGYEDRVIAGGRKLISRSRLLLVETSFVSLYEGQPLFGSIYETLTRMGFSYVGSWSQLRSPSDGAILQADAIFLKRC